MELKVFVEWIFSGELIDFASSKAFVETFGFGEFQSHIGDLFHFFPIFHGLLL